MKICHITSVHSLFDGRILEKECCSLVKKFDMVYLVGIGEDRDYNGVAVRGVFRKKIGRVQRVLLANRRIIDYALSLNCDVYHLHDPELLCQCKRIKNAGRKVIFDSHEDVPRQVFDKKWIPNAFRKTVSIVYERYEKSICKGLDGVVVATEKIYEVFASYGVNSVVIHNYPKINSTFPANQDVDNKQLCFAGSLSESNGIIQLIDIIEKIPNVKLVLAGPIHEAVKKRYESTTAKDRINYLGILSHDEVKKLYKESEIGVVVDLPTGNNIEGLPIKLFEYMEAELPIITSNYKIRKEIFDKYPCGLLVNPLDADECKRAILELLNNDVLRKECSKNGFKAVHEKYNWGYEEEKLIKMYEAME